MTSSLSVVRGLQTPRVHSAPPRAGSVASEAIYLAAQYGLVADPWQELVLEDWLAVKPSGKWACPRCGCAAPRQNGKNVNYEIDELYCTTELGTRFLHTAHEVKTARKAFARLLSFFDNRREFPDLYEMVREIRRTNGQEAIYLRNGGSVEFIARSKSSGRGYSVDTLVLDEAQELTEDAYAALLPTISVSPNPQQILGGTPPAPTANGEVFTRMRTAGVAGKDPRLCWHEWGCQADGEEALDLDDIDNVAQANPALGDRLDYETVVDEREAMSDETFARERLGVWEGAGGSSVINLRAWTDLGDRESGIDGPLAFAIELSGDRRRVWITVAGRRGDGLAHLEIIEMQRGTAAAAVRMAELIRRHRPCATVVDPAGPTGALLSALKTEKADPHLVTAREYAQACGAFFDLVENEKGRHLGDPRMLAAIEAAGKRALGDLWVWHPHNSEADIAPLKSMTLALHGLETFGSRRERTNRAAFF